MPDYDERVRAGEYVDAEGKVLGTHAGFVNYTIGQRKGLGIALGHPAYVTRIDADANRVTLGSNDDMYASSLRFRLITPIKPIPDPAKPIMAKIRYRSKAVQLKTPPFSLPMGEGRGEGFSLSFCEPVWGVTPGQSVVLYQDNLLLGGGIIV